MKWLSMSEAAPLTPYSAEYLSLLARKKKLTAKKVGNTWYTTKAILDEYMKRQMIRNQIQNGDLSALAAQARPAAEALVQPSVQPPANLPGAEIISAVPVPVMSKPEVGVPVTVQAPVVAPVAPIAPRAAVPAQSDMVVYSKRPIEQVDHPLTSRGRTFHSDLKSYLNKINGVETPVSSVAPSAETAKEKTKVSFVNIPEKFKSFMQHAAEKNISAPVKISATPAAAVKPIVSAPPVTASVAAPIKPAVPVATVSPKPVAPIVPSKPAAVTTSEPVKPVAPATPAGLDAVAATLAQIADRLDKISQAKGLDEKVKVLPGQPNILRRSFGIVFGSKPLMYTAIALVVFFSVFPTPFVFGMFDSAIGAVKHVFTDATTVMGFRPGTHQNELLLLDKQGNISIMGHIETDGQFRSYAKDGIAPIVVDSKTEVKNLNSEMVGGNKATDFTLAYVTKNGNVTTEDVFLNGNVEAGKTLLVRGATKLLSSLDVDGGLSVLGDAKFSKSLAVEGPAYFSTILNAANIRSTGVAALGEVITAGNVSVGKNIAVRGSIEAGHAVNARSAAFGSLGVSGDFSASGKITLGNSDDEIVINSKNATLDEDGNLALQGGATIAGSLNVAGGFTGNLMTVSSLVATNASTTFLVAFESSTTNATTTSLFASVGHIVSGVIDSLSSTAANIATLAANSISVGALTATNSTTTNATTTNIYAANANIDNLAANSLTSYGTSTFPAFAATSTTATSTIAGNLNVTGNLAFGNGIGTKLSISSAIASDLVPDVNITRNIGSPAFYWKNGYFDNINVNNISAASTTIGGTASNSFTINSDNVSADAEDMQLIFKRGSVTPNALIAWNSATKRFELNQPVFIQNQSNGDIVTLDVQGNALQTTDLFRVSSTTGARYFAVANNGNVGIGTTTPSAKLSVEGDAYIGGNLTVTGAFSVGALNLQGLLFTNATGTSATTTNLFAATGHFTNGSIDTLTSGSITATGTLSVSGAFLPNVGNNIVLSTNASGVVTGTSSPSVASIFATSTTATSTFAGGIVGPNNFVVQQATGYVGIGTTNPSDFLSVSGNRASIGINNTSGGGNGVKFYNSGSYKAQIGVSGVTDAIIVGNNTGDLAIRAANQNINLSVNDGASIQATLASNGNFGIGTTSPFTRLGVAGDTYIGGNFTATGTSRLVGALTFSALPSCAGGQALQTDANGNVSCGSLSGGGITSAGGWTTNGIGSVTLSTSTDLVGIGTSSPSRALSVQGSVLISGDIASVANINATGTINIASTTASNAGLILQNNVSLIHSYGLNDFFAGMNAGNFTLTSGLGRNTGVGVSALASLTTGNTNTAIGFESMKSDTSGNSNTALGYQTLLNNTIGTQNVAIGSAALKGLTAGTQNVAVGGGLFQVSTSTTNTAIGTNAGNVLADGTDNTFLGAYAGGHPVSGGKYSDENTIIGAMSGYDIGGSRNVILGAQVANTINGFDGSNNIVVGYNISLPNTTDSNMLDIGNLIYGTGIDTAGTIADSDAKIGIGTTSPSQRLSVQGSGLFSGDIFAANLTATGTASAASFVATAPSATSTFAGFIDVNGTGSNATSTFASNLWVKGTLRTGTGSLYLNDASINAANGGFKITTTGNSYLNAVSGNLGIGTTSPFAKLSVAGDAYIGGNLTATGTTALQGTTFTNATGTNATTTNFAVSSLTLGRIPFVSTGGALIDSANLAFDNTVGKVSTVYASTTAITSSGSAYFATAGGNVGIGTTNPGAKLTVTSNVGGGANQSVFDMTDSNSVLHEVAIGANTLRASFGTISNNDLALGTNNNFSQLYLQANGNVGIGTTSPFARLSVAGDAYIGGNLTATGTLTVAGGFTATGTSTASAFIATAALSTSTFAGGFSSAGSSGLTVLNSNGNVIVGTSTPFAKFTVEGVGGDGSAAAFGNGSSQNLLTIVPGSTVQTITTDWFGGGAETPIALGTWTNRANQLYLATSGNVGIGTSSPSQLLNLYANTPKIQIDDSSTHTGTTIRQGGAISNALAGLQIIPDTNFSISTNAQANQFVVNTSGNVGIGTTGPGARLHVAGPTAVGMILEQTAGAGSFNNQIVFKSNSTNNWQIGTDVSAGGTTGNFEFYSAQKSGGAATTLTLAKDGNIGIGTTNPLALTDIKVATDQHFIFRNAAGTSALEAVNDANNNNTSFTLRGNPLILNDGATKVGIGTTSPARKLQVSDTSTDVQARFGDGNRDIALEGQTGNGVSEFLRMQSISNNRRLVLGSSGIGSDIYLTTSNGNNVVVQSSTGNVGIGTTSPNRLFQVYGSNPDIAIMSSASTRDSWRFRADDTTQRLALVNDTSGQGEVMSILRTGNIGVGTSTPQSKFVVDNDGSGVISSVEINPVSAQNRKLTIKEAEIRSSRPSGGSIDAFIDFDPVNGYVGVGTTTPSQVLSVQGSGIFSGNISAAGINATGTVAIINPTANAVLNLQSLSTANSSNIRLTADTSLIVTLIKGNNSATANTNLTNVPLSTSFNSNGDLYMGTSVSNPIVFYTGGSTASNERMRIDSAGNVGIGTTTPDAKLVVTQSGSGALNSIIAEDNARRIKIGRDQVQVTDLSNNSQQLYLNPTGGVSIAATSGNVGIGTTSPQALLGMQGGIGVNSTQLYLGAAGGVGINTSILGNAMLTLQSRGVSGSIIRSFDPTSGLFNFFLAQSNTGAATLTLNEVGGGQVFLNPEGASYLSNGFGIGTTSPWAQLSVNPNGISGPAFAIGSSTKTTFMVSNGGFVGVGTSNPTNLFEVDSLSNLGITATNGQNLSVTRTSNAGFSIINGQRARGSLSAPTALNSGDNITAFDGSGYDGASYIGATQILSVVDGTVSSGIVPGALTLSTADASGSMTERMRINSSGNVGIGNAAALGAKLEITKSSTYSNEGTPGIAINTGTNGQPEIVMGTDNSATAGYIQSLSKGTSYSGVPLALQPNAGNVGIGTTGPGAKLEVAGGNIMLPDAGILYSHSDLWQIGEASNNVFNGTQLGIGTFDTKPIQFAANNAVAMTILNGGNVGIGTTTPISKLTVVGGSSGDLYPSNAQAVFEYNANGGIAIATPDANAAGVYFSKSADAYYAGIERSVSTLNLRNNGATRMVIDSSGNVGIGTTSPADDLEVYGGKTANIANIRLASKNGLDTLQYGQLTFDRSGTYDRLALAVDGTSVLNALSSGNVGIGATNPSSKLQVNMSTDGNAFSIFNASSGWPVFRVNTSNGTVETGSNDGSNPFSKFTNTGARLLLTANSSATAVLRVMANSANNGDNTKAILAASDSSENDKFIVTAAGNVGIGTTTPAYKLDVSGTQFIENGFGNPNTESAYRLKFYDNGGTNNDAGIGLDGTSGGGEKMWFNALAGFYFNYGTNNAKVTFDSSGNVGIGTTTPATLLQLSATNTVSPSITLNTNNTNTANGFIKWTNQGATGQAFIGSNFNTSDSSGNLEFGTGGTATRMLITSGGNVGIGTTTPGSKLSISGGLSVGADYTLAAPSNGAVFEGNVGIGTPSPLNAPLTVEKDRVDNGNADHLAQIVVAGASASDDRLLLGYNTTSDNGFVQSFHNHVGATSLVLQALGGNVGIGTTTPDQKLSVYGSLDVGNSGQILVPNGSDSLPSYTFTSVPNTGFLYDGSFGAVAVSVAGTRQFNFANGALYSPNSSSGAYITSGSTVNAGSPAYSFFGDTSSGMFSPVANELGFSTNSNERMRINSTGNVGIGTSSPADNLHIYKAGSDHQLAIDASGQLSTIDFKNKNVLKAQLYWDNSASIFNIQTNSTSNSIALQPVGGNVGIGTTANTGSLVDVEKASGNAISIISDNAPNSYVSMTMSASANYSDFVIGSTKNAGRFSSDAAAGDVVFKATNSGNIVFANDGSGSILSTPASSLVIASTKKIGIGTSSPASLLTVVGGGACFSGSGATAACGNTAGNLYYRTANTGTYDIAENYRTSDLTIGAGDIVAIDASASNAVMKASPGSRVLGIVSTDPGMVLGGADAAVMNSSSTRPVALSGRVPVKVNGEGGSIAVGDHVSLSSTPGVGKKAVGSEEAVGIALESWTGGALDQGLITVFVSDRQAFDQSQFSIDGSGNVGVGTTTPLYKMQVNGDIAATAFVNVSTRSAKKDISYLDDATKLSMLDKLKTIGVATYRYNTESDTAPLRMGLIAEEAPAEVLADTGKGVDVYKLSTFILSGVQELAKKFDDLDKKVAANTTDIASLESSITDLQGKLAALSSASTSAASTTQTVTWSSDFGAQVVAFFETAGLKLENGIAYIKNAVVDSLTATTAYVNNATIDSASVGALTIGSAEKRTGITLYDQLTGDPYCLQIAGGQTRTQPGTCPAAATSTPVAAPQGVSADGQTGVSGSFVQMAPSGTAGTTTPSTVENPVAATLVQTNDTGTTTTAVSDPAAAASSTPTVVTDSSSAATSTTAVTVSPASTVIVEASSTPAVSTTTDAVAISAPTDSTASSTTP